MRWTILSTECFSTAVLCYQAEDPLEAFPLGGGNTRARSEVAIDGLDLRPTQSAHPFSHRILEELTFLVLSYLSVAGLSKVHYRLANQVLRFRLMRQSEDLEWGINLLTRRKVEETKPLRKR